MYRLPKGALFLAKCEKGKGGHTGGGRGPLGGGAGGGSGEGAGPRGWGQDWPRACYLFTFGKDVPFRELLRGLGCAGAAPGGSSRLLPQPAPG